MYIAKSRAITKNIFTELRCYVRGANGIVNAQLKPEKTGNKSRRQKKNEQGQTENSAKYGRY